MAFLTLSQPMPQVDTQDMSWRLGKDRVVSVALTAQEFGTMEGLSTHEGGEEGF